MLGLYAIFAAGRGFKEFIEQTNAASTALGRFSAQLGQSPQMIGELQSVVQLFGGTAAETNAALEGANKVIQDFLVNGKGIPEVISRMTSQVGGSVDFNHGVLAYYTSLAPILQRMNDLDPAKAHAFAQALNIPDSLARAMEQYGSGLKLAMDALGNIQPTNAQIEAATALNKKWVEVQQHISSLGQTIDGVIDGPMTHFLDITEKIVDELKKVIEEQTQLTPGQKEAFGNVEKKGFFGELYDEIFGGKSYPTGNGAARGLSFGGSGGKEISLERAEDGGLGGSGLGGAGGARSIEVAGSEISENNPLPVRLIQNGGGGGGSLWDWLTGGAGGGGGPGGGNPILSGLSAVGGLLGGRGGGGGASDSYGSGSSHIPKGQGLARASHLVDHLMSKYGLTRTQALGAAGVMGYESGDFTTMQEGGQAPGHGGWGYAQWTGPRRRDFMAWTSANKLDPSSVEANEGFLDHELAGNYAHAIAAIKRTNTVAAAANSWEHAFEGMTEGGPGIPAFGAHIGRALAYAKIPALNGSVGAGQAALSSTANNYSATTSSSVNSMHIGKIDISTQATDAAGIAAGIQPALAKHGFAQFANGGPM